MIPVSKESLIQFCDLPSAIQRITGKRPALSTLHRWRMKGLSGVALETIKIGGQRFTSEEALSRFFQRKTAEADGENVVVSSQLSNSAGFLESEGF